MRGLEKRVAAGLDPDVRSVASVFISRWDRAIVEDVPDELKNRLGNAVGQHAYRAYRAAGIDIDALARRLQVDGAKAFVTSWEDLLTSIGAKSKALA
jgi:transaldolase